METIRWFRRASEFALGTALVLAHLALSGRGLRLLNFPDDEREWSRWN
jgi:hypothetical protein